MPSNFSASGVSFGVNNFNILCIFAYQFIVDSRYKKIKHVIMIFKVYLNAN